MCVCVYFLENENVTKIFMHLFLKVLNDCGLLLIFILWGMYFYIKNLFNKLQTTHLSNKLNTWINISLQLSMLFAYKYSRIAQLCQFITMIGVLRIYYSDCGNLLLWLVFWEFTTGIVVIYYWLVCREFTTVIVVIYLST